MRMRAHTQNEVSYRLSYYRIAEFIDIDALVSITPELNKEYEYFVLYFVLRPKGTLDTVRVQAIVK